MPHTSQTFKPSQETPELMRVALLVEYNGAAYAGSQLQAKQPTIQQSVQDALAELKLKTSAVTFAGRTDAGVHARGQVGHFDMPRDGLKNIPDLGQSLSAKLLRHGIAIRDFRSDVGFDFQSRRSAEQKWYRYQVYNADHPSVWAPKDSVWVRNPLDVEKMDEAAALLMGRHAFTSFKCPDTAVTDDICDVRCARVKRQGELVIFDIVADRFLYKMVRNLMGELLGLGKTGSPLPTTHLQQVLEARQRFSGSHTAKAEGLSLMAVQYQPPYRFFEHDRYVQELKSLIETSTKPFSQPMMESTQNELQNLFRKAS